MDFERTRRRTHELNLIPLIDIVFHLLIFVMFTTTFVVSESMELSLPAGKGAAAPAEVTTIQIAPSGDIYLNQQPTPVKDLTGYLTNKLGADPDSKIAIFSTPGVSVQQLVSVLDTVYLTGGRNVQVDKIDQPAGGA